MASIYQTPLLFALILNYQKKLYNPNNQKLIHTRKLYSAFIHNGGLNTPGPENKSVLKAIVNIKSKVRRIGKR